MIVEDKINVHPDLCELHKSAKCCSTTYCCCESKPELSDNLCLTFVSCGPGVKCGTPCRHCLAWEGYGGYKTVQAIKNQST